jgi:hypothetical protein
MRLKKVISYLLLIIWLPILCLPLCGFTASGQATIKHSGKGEAAFFVESALEESAFQKKIEEVVEDFNIASGSSDMVRLKRVEKEDALYKVDVSFRRIDKVHPRGSFYLHKAEALKAKQSEELDRFGRWERGDINCTAYVFYNRLRGLAQIKKPREDGPTVVIKPTSASGEKLSVKNFAEKISKENDILAFQLLDTLGVQKIQISLPGTITYYGGNIKLINGNSFEITPISVQAEITKVDENNNYESVVTKEEIQTFVGYVAFQKSISPFEITMIVIAALSVVLFVSFALVYFYQRGKMVQARENMEKEFGDA